MSIGLEQILTYMFVMIGPVKVIVPFARMTAESDSDFRRKLAVRSTIYGTISLAIAASIGVSALEQWRLSTDVVLLTVGIILFVIALLQVLEVYRTTGTSRENAATATSETVSLQNAFSPLAFPILVTPYGIAAVIFLLALPDSRVNPFDVYLGIALMMSLNLVAMLLAQVIVKTPGLLLGLRLFGATLGVLQVALGAQIIIFGLRGSIGLG